MDNINTVKLHAQNIYQVCNTNKFDLTSNNSSESLDLIALTKPLIDISKLNKKYSSIVYDESFLNELTESELNLFLTQIKRMNMQLIKFFYNYHQSLNRDVDEI